MRKLIAFTMLFCAVKSHAQWSLALQKDTQLVAGSLSVDVPVDGSGKTIRQIAGSGFLYSSGNWFYFVTAKHVVTSILQSGIKKAYLLTHVKGDFPDVPAEFVIDISTAILNQGLYLSPRDVAIIRLGRSGVKFIAQPYFHEIPLDVNISGNKSYSRMMMTVDKSEILPFANVDISEDVVVSGFPSSLNAYPDIVSPLYESDWPLLRKGIVSGKNNVTRQIVIDVPVFPGNSGGPVILVRQNNLTTKTTYIIGIVLEFIPFVSKSREEHQMVTNVNIANSGYTIVEPADTFLALVSLAENQQ